MTKRVIYEVSNYRMKIARLFLSRSEIAKPLGVTFTAVRNWETGRTPMKVDDMKRLEDVIMNRAHDIHKEWDLEPNSFGGKLKGLITEALLDAPETFYITGIRSRQNSEKLAKLKDRLIFLLHGKRRRADAIKETLLEEGYSVGQIQRASKELKVRKDTKGFGIKIKSYWSLK